ncbi:uncharacterized protein LOC129725831 [Wyeomyia smithii]|uniref:uncharacterized protein LOC129725831 n=1 Tax=Wyeomyia smithii TaxID=174621 RepID=UPI002467F0AD|nr:uncharacterized protein LOC129725831 [Wyeomyia smithii]
MTSTGFILTCVFLAVVTQIRAQGNTYPNEYTWGAITAATNTPCFSDSVNVWNFFRVADRVLAFTPASAITFIRCWNNLPLHPFMATVTSGGVGLTTQCTIVLSSYHGKLVAQCQAYCA